MISFFILLSIMSCSTIPQSKKVEETEPGFVILDILLYRPAGLVVTVIGAGAFIGLSPLTAFASIPEPHDAFVKTGKILILSPAAYTFIRPIGDRDFPYQYHPSPYKRKPAATHNNAVTPKQGTVSPPAPDAKSPQSSLDTGKGL